MDISTLIPIITATLGASVVYVFESKKESKRIILQKREEQYHNLSDNALGFFEDYYENDEKKKRFIKEISVQAPLYASDEVIKLSNEFAKSFYGEISKKNKKEVESIIVN